MKKDDVYTKHVRGSRYGFSFGKLFYKYPGGGKSYAIGDWDKIVDDCCEIRGNTSGRLIINEEKEIITYKQEEEYKWVPYYVGKLDNKMRFEDIENNPENLRPGLLWTGFASHHGAKFNFTRKGNMYFKETTFDEDGQTTKKFKITDIDEEILERLKYFKIEPGAFHINEYGHIWAPVPKTLISEFYNTDIIHIDDIHKQFKQLTSAQKITISKYSEPRYNRNSHRQEMWYPIYIGKYTKPLKINREDAPHIISSEDWL